MENEKITNVSEDVPDTATDQNEVSNMISQHSQPQPTKKKWLFPVTGLLILCSLFLVIAYLYFQSHFFVTAKANGVAIGWLNVDAAKNKLDEMNKNEQVVIKIGEKEEKIDIPQKYLVTEDYLNDHIHSTTIDLPVNEAYKQELQEKLNALVIEGGTPSQDAHLERINEKYQIVPEQQGTVVNKEALIQKIMSDVERGTGNFVYDTKDFYQKPQITKNSNELAERLSLITKRENKTITLNINNELLPINKEELQSFIDETGNIKEDTVYAWIEQINQNCGTIFQPIYFTNVHGETRKYKNNGSYGWDINMPKTRDLIVEALKSDKDQETIEVPIDGDITVSNTVNKDYVEIDLNNQKMYFFKNGAKMVETDVITGRYNKGTATVPGFHTILYKDTDTKLEGEMLDGSKYSVPVKYWMPLKSYGGVVTQIGIHDADYKSEYFGNKQAYKTNFGSNGCINTPGDAVSKIFENAYAGLPVIIYGTIYDDAPGEYDKPVEHGEAV